MTTHTPDRSKLPDSLINLDWHEMRPDIEWRDGQQLLVAIPVCHNSHSTDWRYEVYVVCLAVDEDIFQVECNGEVWGWDLSDADWYVTIRG